MGMAASQARYLSLVARKVNIEYEGQQINQARTSLSNKSANLFNQMLGLQVPVPPSTQDYTTMQYSFTDGINPAVIDKWEQLATPDDNGYNYVVEYHYEARNYKGFQKQMNDPQIQFSYNIPTDTSTSVEKAQVDLIYEKQTAVNNAKKTYEEKLADYEQEVAKASKIVSYRDTDTLKNIATASGTSSMYATYSSADKKVTPTYYYSYNDLGKDVTMDKWSGGLWKDADGNVYSQYTEVNTPVTDKTTLFKDTDGNIHATQSTDPEHPYTALANTDNIYVTENGIFTINAKTNGKDNTLVKTVYEDSNNNLTTDGGTSLIDDNTPIYFNISTGVLTTSDKSKDPNYTLIIDDDKSKIYFSQTNKNQLAIQKRDGTNVPSTFPQTGYTKMTFGDATQKAQLKQIIDDWEANGVSIDRGKVYVNSDLTNIVFTEDLENLNGAGGIMTRLYSYHPGTATTQPSGSYETIYHEQAVLASKKTEAENAHAALKVAETELEQVNMPTYIGNTKLTSLSELTQEQFAEIKQIITDMTKNGVSTNFDRCFSSALSPSASNYKGGIYSFVRDGVTYYTTYYDLADTANDSDFMNKIDNQPKLNYYHANYVTENVDKVQKAVLDTDSKGRFKTVRFEDGSQYSLNFEEVTDDEAYKDAMNQYNYKVAEYDKMVQDLNAQTSVIQAEDRTLELRLKQMETEQSALSNEIEAVQKIIKEDVDKSFKTFSG